MAVEQAVRLGGETVLVLGDRALYRPARQALLIADLHLGKADLFRRAGIGLPRGGTAHDLARLAALLAARPVRTLWILGDVLHGAVFDAAWRDHWQRWREGYPAIDMVAVRGNHDRALRVGIGLRDVGTHVVDAGLLLRHEPVPDPALHVLCGHVHPQCELPGLRRRFPAFWLRDGMTVLPAFSHFTAGVAPTLATGERLVACVEHEAIALPPAR